MWDKIDLIADLRFYNHFAVMPILLLCVCAIRMQKRRQPHRDYRFSLRIVVVLHFDWHWHSQFSWMENANPSLYMKANPVCGQANKLASTNIYRSHGRPKCITLRGQRTAIACRKHLLMSIIHIFFKCIRTNDGQALYAYWTRLFYRRNRPPVG